MKVPFLLHPRIWVVPTSAHRWPWRASQSSSTWGRRGACWGVLWPEDVATCPAAEQTQRGSVETATGRWRAARWAPAVGDAGTSWTRGRIVGEARTENRKRKMILGMCPAEGLCAGRHSGVLSPGGTRRGSTATAGMTSALDAGIGLEEKPNPNPNPNQTPGLCGWSEKPWRFPALYCFRGKSTEAHQRGGWDARAQVLCTCGLQTASRPGQEGGPRVLCILAGGHTGNHSPQLNYSMHEADQPQDIGLWGQMPPGPRDLEKRFPYLRGHRTTWRAGSASVSWSSDLEILIRGRGWGSRISEDLENLHPPGTHA